MFFFKASDLVNNIKSFYVNSDIMLLTLDGVGNKLQKVWHTVTDTAIPYDACDVILCLF